MSRWFKGRADSLLDVVCGACLTSRRLVATSFEVGAFDLLKGRMQ